MDVVHQEQAEDRDVFSRDGFLWKQKQLWSSLSEASKNENNLVSDWHDLFDDLWSFIFRALFEHGHTAFATEHTMAHPHDGSNNDVKMAVKKYALDLGIKHGFREIVMRSLGRYELSLLNHTDWFRKKNGFPLLERLKSTLVDVVPPLFGKTSWDELNIANLSFVVSTPGAVAQGWHADGGHISLDEHKPCHCLNVFIPLQDIPSIEWGPTELRPGSHYYTRNLAPMVLAAKCRKELRPTEAPLLQQGDVLIFDYRILHRGLANRTLDRNRAVLVLTVSEPWFEDRLNFPQRSLYDHVSKMGTNKC